MDVRVLRYFLAIAQEHNISHAAHFLHISQPALSRQISDLETELGVKLFERGPRSIKLTSQGHYLRERAQEIISLVDKTEYNLQASQLSISGELDIGGGESIGMQRIMDVISEIIQDYPNVQIHLHSGDAADVEAKLDAGTLDFGVIMGFKPLQQYNSLRLPDKNYWGVILPAASPLKNKTAITPQDLLGYPLVISEQAQQADRFQDWWRPVFEKLHIVGTYNLIFNAALLVKNQGCLALSFEHLIDLRNSQLEFRRLKPTVLEPITIIWKQNQTLSSVAQLFLQRLKTNIAAQA
ncbi:LysR family transcriptional regulator [Bombilactobacillus bombi]|uniref:LysR family transcriptional regulator n=1 Tax=Bombilactobacillus bombi TaxID=1303590 RepID=UPI0015E620BC|nr:LysR family transcriptional regulator [Bombilactobacillus bombi]MBA1433735.1 LysR family transcriptional regulator [Bombilactobacillus bombi]